MNEFAVINPPEHCPVCKDKRKRCGVQESRVYFPCGTTIVRGKEKWLASVTIECIGTISDLRYPKFKKQVITQVRKQFYAQF